MPTCPEKGWGGSANNVRPESVDAAHSRWAMTGHPPASNGLPPSYGRGTGASTVTALPVVSSMTVREPSGSRSRTSTPIAQSGEPLPDRCPVTRTRTCSESCAKSTLSLSSHAETVNDRVAESLDPCARTIFPSTAPEQPVSVTAARRTLHPALIRGERLF